MSDFFYLLPFPLPTRNGRAIDKIFINWEKTEADCMPPLEAQQRDGLTYSDHKVQILKSYLTTKAPSPWKKITFRPYNQAAAEKFKQDIEREDWADIYQAVGSNAKADAFQASIDRLMELHFPFKSIRRKDSDLPWLNELAKKKIKRKKAIFRDEHKSPRWYEAKEDLEKYLEKRRTLFLEKQRTKVTGNDAAKNFHANVKNYQSAEKPKTFNIMDMRPGKEEREVANEVAGYFNRISAEFSPLQPWEIPTTYHRQLDRLTPAGVEERLRLAKKPNSMVEGDLFPKLVNPCAKALSAPLAAIYNSILDTFVWPITWKREYVTVIPKKSMPESFADLRNISCTKLFSKVFEAFVLERAAEEITLKDNQYGGVKGCSTAHMLIDIWQNICENAEDYRAATVLTAIDYSKAFNRLSFQHCLDAFKKKGASTTIIRLIATFLTNRHMSVRVGNSWSDFLPVFGGCPQGSILGVFLFNTTTDDLEDDFLRHEDERLGIREAPPILEAEGPMNDEIDSSIEDAGPPTSSSPAVPGHTPPTVDLSPVGTTLFKHSNLILQFNNYAVNVPQPPQPHFLPQPREEAVGTQVLVEKPVKIRKYIDDCVIIEKSNYGTEPIVAENGKQTKTKCAAGTQNAFNGIVPNAEYKGMVVNTQKTQMLCISDSLNYLPNSFIHDRSGVKIVNNDSMKVLGFMFSNRPNVKMHVDSLCKKFRRKYWMLRHLKLLGFNELELVKTYQCNILPIADYCSVVYHSLLTDEQDEQLENAQVGALRAIFGYKISGRKMRQKAQLKTLRERRIEQCDKFATKCSVSDRFRHWFPLKDGRRSERNPEKYKEMYARCDRLKDSPLFYMRRRLNGKEGKKYGERYRIYRES